MFFKILPKMMIFGINCSKTKSMIFNRVIIQRKINIECLHFPSISLMQFVSILTALLPIILCQSSMDCFEKFNNDSILIHYSPNM